MAETCGPTSSLFVLCMKVNFRTDRKGSTVSFRNSAITIGKNTALRAKNQESSYSPTFFGYKSIPENKFFSGAQRNGVFALDDVFSCAATSGEVKVGAGACSQAQSHDFTMKARRAKTSEEGLFLFFS